MMRKRTKYSEIKLIDYGDAEINRLGQLHDALDRMTDEERLRAFIWLKGRYAKSWPSDQSY